MAVEDAIARAVADAVRTVIREELGALRPAAVGSGPCLSPAAWAKEHGVSVATTLRAIRAGRLSAERVGRQWRIQRGAVMASTVSAPAAGDLDELARLRRAKGGGR